MGKWPGSLYTDLSVHSYKGKCAMKVLNHNVEPVRSALFLLFRSFKLFDAGSDTRAIFA